MNQSNHLSILRPEVCSNDHRAILQANLFKTCGLQGRGHGGAEVSLKHAGFIINKNNATASDYIETINMVKVEVKEKFGVELELEVKL